MSANRGNKSRYPDGHYHEDAKLHLIPDLVPDLNDSLRKVDEAILDQGQGPDIYGGINAS